MSRMSPTGAYVLVVLSATVTARAQVPVDAARAGEVEKLAAACEAKDAASCFELADLRWNGTATGWREDGRAREAFRKGLSSDPALALVTLDQSCEKGSARGCFRLGLAYEEAPDHAKAMQAWEKACSGGDPDGCFQVAWDVETGAAQR